MNPSEFDLRTNAVLRALLDDYVERISEITGEDAQQIKTRVLIKADQIYRDES